MKIKSRNFIFPCFVIVFLIYYVNTLALSEKKFKFTSSHKLGHKLKTKHLLKHKLRSKTKASTTASTITPLPATIEQPELPGEVPQQDLGDSDGNLSKNQFQVLMKNRHMTIGEVDHIFATISVREWDYFYKIFVTPFETICDTDKDYVLTEAELGVCIETSELKEMNLTAANATAVMEMIDRGVDDLVNFADFMFLRRVNLAWQECAAGVDISRIRIPCAMKIAVPGWIIDKSESYEIVDINTILREGKLQFEEPYLKIIDYIGMAHVYYYFYSFEIPYLGGVIRKKDIIRAIDYQKVPTSLNNYLINEMFTAGLEEMEFFTFAAILWCYRQFKRHAKVNKFMLLEEEFVSIFDEISFSRNLLYYIDTYYVPTLEEYMQISDAEKNLTEKDYLITFLQVSQAATTPREDLLAPANPINRKIIYHIFGIVTWKEMRDGYLKYKPPIPFSTIEESYLNNAIDFISGISHNILNIKQFYDLFNYRDIFAALQVPNFVSFVTYANLLRGLDMLGLRLTNKTKKASRQGSDPSIRIPMYNYYAGFKNSIKEEILAIRMHRNQLSINESKNSILNSAV